MGYNRGGNCHLQSLRETSRHQLLAQQFSFETSTLGDEEIQESLERIFTYVYSYTNIWYIDFIDEGTLYNYIKKQQELPDGVDFYQAVRDVKNYLYFLRYIKRSRNIPDIDLSIQNLLLWTKM